MKKITLLLLFLLLISNPAFGQSKKSGYIVSCQVEGFADGAKFVLVNLDNEKETYTEYLKDGKLVFRGKVSEPTVFRMFPKDESDKSIYLNFWIENKTISLIVKKDNFANPIIKGSPLNKADRKVIGQYQNLQSERDNLMRKLVVETDEKKFQETLKTVNEIDKKILEARLHTITALKPSLVTIKELFFLRNDLKNSDLGEFFNKFPNYLKTTKYGNVISQYLAVEEIKVGAKAADISGKDSANRTFKLSDFKEKVVLLDFWAAWCSPCRKSNKELAEIYRKYQAKGFEIVSFSTDTDSVSWQTASQIDGVTWTNITDLQGFYSSGVAAFKVRSLPRAFLLNKAGEIVHIFSGYDSKAKNILEEKIQELIK